MSRTTYPELYFIITNVCKPPQNFDFPETEQPFTFVLLEEFQWVSYCSWEDGTYYLPQVLFGPKNVENFSQETISNMANNSKNIKKTSKCSHRNLLIDLQMNKYDELMNNPFLFLKRRNENFEKLSRRGNQFFNKSSGETTVQERENIKVVGVMGFFRFHF